MSPKRRRLSAIVKESCACCWVERCVDSGCKVSLPRGAAPRAILSGTKYQGNHDHGGVLCDFVVFLSPGHVERVYAMELKSGAVDVSRALEQIQAGARIAEHLTADSPVDFFSPVLVHGKRIPTPERKVLAQGKVSFRGKYYEVFTLKCGYSIEDVD